MLQIFGKRGVRQLWKYWLFELGEIHGKIISFCFGKTVVEDGDMKNLLTIDKVAFTNKQHYNCKCRICKRADWGYEIVPND